MGKLSPVSAYLIAGGLLAAAFLVLRRDVANLAGGAVDLVTGTAATIGAAVNPVSDQNIFYRGVGAVTQTVTAGKSETLGDAIFEFFNPGAGNWVSDPTPVRPRTYGQ